MNRQFLIGNDIDRIYWDIFSKQDVPEDLTVVDDMVLIARHRVLRTVIIQFDPVLIPEDEKRLSVIIPSANIKQTGFYDLELTYKKQDLAFPGGVRSCRVTNCDAFEVVEKSCEVILPDDPLVIEGIVGALRGYSAYEVAVKNGFAGTEPEWLETHKLRYEDLTVENIEQLQQPAIEAAEQADEAAEGADYYAGIAFGAAGEAGVQAGYAKQQGDYAKAEAERINGLDLLSAVEYSGIDYNEI